MSDKKTGFNKLRGYLPAFLGGVEEITPKQEINPKADFVNSGGILRNSFSVSYDGEKNHGEIGPIKSYIINYELLRLRSWQSYLESEITQTIVNSFATWVIGKGLKLQSEPAKTILDEEGIKVDLTKFTKTVEARFNQFKKSKESDYAGMCSLDEQSVTTFINSIVGGDILVILRYDTGKVTVQLVDATHLQSPQYGTESFPQILPNGNRVLNGIEIDNTGKHVAYWVRNWKLPNINFTTDRIPAYGVNTGMKTCFIVYGSKYRLDNIRGLPIMATTLETIKKLERYKEAMVGSAEERAKIAFTIEHQIGSTGENPLVAQMVRAHDRDKVSDAIPVDIQGKELANKFTATTNKQAFNMPQGAKLAMHDSKNELHFKDFYSVNTQLICSALGIPPEVALSKYDSNFSASRAALKDWEHTLNVKRSQFTEMFMQPIYNFWLEMQIVEMHIQAPGYLPALLKGENNAVIEAYRTARFVGPAVPHIDPLKEVEAERLKLGTLGAHVPLTTVEQATENLNNGESSSNMEQYSGELNHALKLGLKAVEVVVAPVDNKKKKKPE